MMVRYNRRPGRFQALSPGPFDLVTSAKRESSTPCPVLGGTCIAVALHMLEGLSILYVPHRYTSSEICIPVTALILFAKDSYSMHIRVRVGVSVRPRHHSNVCLLSNNDPCAGYNPDVSAYL